MKRQKPLRDNLSQFRAAIDADDGRDPRDFFMKETRLPKAGRKAQQLSTQVAETLQQLLGESTDETLESLHVAEIVPATDASQLLVLVTPAAGTKDFNVDVAADALRRASGWLRSEVAAAITRKRAPQLVFRVLPGLAAKEDEQ